MSMARRTSVVVLAGDRPVGDRGARALAGSLRAAGVDTRYLGREANAHRIAASAVDSDAQAVEVCVSGGGAVPLLRELLREFRRLGRPEVSIVVRRVQ
jgi:methylmalonyl-CoA mutase cobalamin-binding domain/chain